MNQTVVNDAHEHAGESITSCFVDLADLCSKLKSEKVDARIKEMVALVGRGAAVTAIGSFPIIGDTWCGLPVTVARIQQEIRNALGTSGLLTYMNRSRYSLNELSDICLKYGHDWIFHGLTLSLLFTGYDPQAELAFSRDRRFLMSWPVTKDNQGSVFVATGSLKDWLKFTRHQDDPSFDIETRQAMKDAGLLLAQLLPDEDRGQHFMVNGGMHRLLLSSISLKSLSVLEIGVGHGELTEIILERNPVVVLGYEIEQGLCQFRHSRFFLVEDSILNLKKEAVKGWCIISNPPYSLLPWIKINLLPIIHDVILLIPERERTAFEYLGFTSYITIDGDSFNPPSKGKHVLVKRGFDVPV
jgi:hypothetical protein